MKALMKEPSKRYQSAEELRDDITRHLKGQPVSAPSYVPDPFRAVQQLEPATGEKSLAILPLQIAQPIARRKHGR